MTPLINKNELVKQVLKIELQEIDEDNDSYKAKEKVARAFIAGLIVRSARDIKNRVVLRVFFVFSLPLYTLLYHCTRFPVTLLAHLQFLLLNEKSRGK